MCSPLWFMVAATVCGGMSSVRLCKVVVASLEALLTVDITLTAGKGASLRGGTSRHAHHLKDSDCRTRVATLAAQSKCKNSRFRPIYFSNDSLVRHGQVTLPGEGQSFALIYSIEDPAGNSAQSGVGAQVNRRAHVVLWQSPHLVILLS